MPDFDQLALRAYLLDAIHASPYADIDDLAAAMGVRPSAVTRCLAGIERPSEPFARLFAETVHRPAGKVLALAGYPVA